MTDTFTQYPLHIDKTTVSLEKAPADVAQEIQELNALVKVLTKELPSDAVPPPPVPVQPQRSRQIQRMRDDANVSFRKGNLDDAVRKYTFAIEMALTRPVWEASGLVKEELSPLYANLAAAHMGKSEWPECLAASEAAIDFNMQNSKAHYRRAKALQNMGRYEEAKKALDFGLEFQGNTGDLKTLLKEVDEALEGR